MAGNLEDRAAAMRRRIATARRRLKENSYLRGSEGKLREMGVRGRVGLGPDDFKGVRNPKKLAVLMAFREGRARTMTGAGRVAGVNPDTISGWMNGRERNGVRVGKDEAFIEAKAQVDREIVDELIDTSLKLATGGIEEDIWYRGEAVGRKKVYSETMLLAELRRRDPGYRQERADMNVSVTFDISERLRAGMMRASEVVGVEEVAERVLEADVIGGGETVRVVDEGPAVDEGDIVI